MRKALVELLAEREIVHPTRLQALSWAAGTLHMTATGHAWWTAPDGPPQEGTIKFAFSGLTDGRLKLEDFYFDEDEALEDFSVVAIEPQSWAGPLEWSIFCSAPIPAPLDVYIRLQDALAAENAFRAPEDFLNKGARLSTFTGLAGSPGFLLARAPGWVRNLLCAELIRQGVAHSVVHNPPDAAGEILVRLGGAAFLCEAADAEF